VISDFHEAAFETWQRESGVEVETESVSLEDIFLAVAGGSKGETR